MKQVFYLPAMLFAGILLFNSCTHEPPVAFTASPAPTPGGAAEVCFESDILPLFQSRCALSGCHDATTHQNNYMFDSYANIIRNDLTPGNATTSKIYQVLFETGKDKMPPLPNADLTTAQKALIGRWINEGAKNTNNCAQHCDSTNFKYAAQISVIMNTYCVGCHAGILPAGGVILNTYTGVNQVAISGRLTGAVSHAPGYSPMPKNTNKLSDCQITQIRNWVNAGALNN